MRSLKQLLGMCEHDWEIESKRNILSNLTNNIIGEFYILQCKKCGTVMRKRLMKN